MSPVITGKILLTLFQEILQRISPGTYLGIHLEVSSEIFLENMLVVSAFIEFMYSSIDFFSEISYGIFFQEFL